MGRKYTGTCDFEFTVKRWNHPACDKWVPLDELKKNHLYDEYAEEKEITLHVTGFACRVEGNISGLPEDCYPDEYDCKIHSVSDESGEDWFDKLTYSEASQIEDLILDKVDYSNSSEYYDHDSYDYDGYDDRYDHRYDDYY
jgi:hypothetical protein